MNVSVVNPKAVEGGWKVVGWFMGKQKSIYVPNRYKNKFFMFNLC